MSETHNEISMLPAALRGLVAMRLLPNVGKKAGRALAAMATSGTISNAELKAANRWYCIYAMASEGVTEVTSNSKSGVRVTLFEQERRVSARTQYRHTKQTLGDRADNRLREFLVCDCSMNDMGHIFGCSPNTVRKVIAKDLVDLASLYLCIKGLMADDFRDHEASCSQLH